MTPGELRRSTKLCFDHPDDGPPEALPENLVQRILAAAKAESKARKGFHWPEYLMEAAGLGLFMVSACAFGTLIEHPASPVKAAIPSATLRRLLMGLAMGGTAISIIFSPWGKQSGAHLNPAVTWTFFRLGKVRPLDAGLYTVFQFAGGLAGVLLMTLVLGMLLADPAVNYVATQPGKQGVGAAFLTEVLISAALMTVVLAVQGIPRLARFTGLFAGAVVAASITLAAPLSGMSMNPARSFASALPAGAWRWLWIYFVAPPLGMLLAAQAFLWVRGRGAVACAKLHHQNRTRCIFCAFHRGAQDSGRRM
jgi:aquaporin Z